MLAEDKEEDKFRDRQAMMMPEEHGMQTAK
jgi:hypothetical protein